jgi:hypothetical protein
LGSTGGSHETTTVRDVTFSATTFTGGDGSRAGLGVGDTTNIIEEGVSRGVSNPEVEPVSRTKPVTKDKVISESDGVT